jgi:hypothetical protein
MLILVSTTQRCGSTWLVRMLQQSLGLESRYIDCRQLGFRLLKQSLPVALTNLAAAARELPYGLLKTHDIPSEDFDGVCSIIPNLRLLTISRDFKDVAVSRFFYYRYYWPTVPQLGPLPPNLQAFYSSVRDLPDKQALAKLTADPLLRGWAREWAAFETPFQSVNVLRLTYDAMLRGVERHRIEEFTGVTITQWQSIAEAQQVERADHGRRGAQCFNRAGRSGQWREWFTPLEARAIDAVQRDAVCSARDRCVRH